MSGYITIKLLTTDPAILGRKFNITILSLKHYTGSVPNVIRHNVDHAKKIVLTYSPLINRSLRIRPSSEDLIEVNRLIFIMSAGSGGAYPLIRSN